MPQSWTRSRSVCLFVCLFVTHLRNAGKVIVGNPSLLHWFLITSYVLPDFLLLCSLFWMNSSMFLSVVSPSVLPSLIDRLGDAKDQVRDHDQTLLLKIMEQSTTPQVPTHTHTLVWERSFLLWDQDLINSEGDFLLCVIIIIIKLTTELLQLLLLSNLWCCDLIQPTHVSWHPTFNVQTTCVVVSLHKLIKWPLEWGFHHPDTSGSSLDWQDILSKLIKTRKFWLSPQKRMYASNFKVWNKIERKIINLIYLYRTFHANMQLKVLHMATLNQRRWNIKTLKR